MSRASCMDDAVPATSSDSVSHQAELRLRRQSDGARAAVDVEADHLDGEQSRRDHFRLFDHEARTTVGGQHAVEDALAELGAEGENEEIVDDDAVQTRSRGDGGRAEREQTVGPRQRAAAVQNVLVGRLRQIDGVRPAHRHRHAHREGAADRSADRTELGGGERGQSEERLQPHGQTEVMIKVAEVGLGNEHGRVRRELHLHQMGRVGQIDAGRISEQSIGRLRVDDQSVGGVVLAHGEGTIDGARCGGEGNHALREHATDCEHVFGAAASDAGPAQRFGGVEAEQLVGGPE